MNIVYLLLGSNLGNSKEQLTFATKHVEEFIGAVTVSSSLYSTAAWGNTDQPDFLNQVIIIDTALAPLALLKEILLIEKKNGQGENCKKCCPHHRY